MPGIFSWKNRLLGRKTPEPERAVHVSLPLNNVADPETLPAKRSVRFDEARNQFQPVESGYEEPEWQNEYGQARVIGSVSPASGSSRNAIHDNRNGGWQYADDVRVSIAPLAAVEDDEPIRPRPSRAGTVLQNLREQRDYVDYSERLHNGAGNQAGNAASLPGGYMGYRTESPATRQLPYRPPEAPFRSRDPYREESPYVSRSLDGPRNQLDEMNVVFLQANDEIKRTILPPDVNSMQQIKMAFVRAFPSITRGFIDQPHVRIYIQEPTKGQLFYELEDPRDIKNKSVLKLREHSNSGMMSPARFLDQPDYHSETEFDDGRTRMLSLHRPASAMAEFGPPKPVRQKSFDPYADPYASDASSHDSRSVTRSGSATPVIDRESRARMETMERQLAGLSTLVHSALVSKGMTETTQRDMAELRNQILALHPETIREASEERNSIPESLSSHTQHQLGTLKHRVQQANNEIRQLRRSAQINAQSARSLLQEAGDQISHIINDRVGGSGGSRQTERAESEKQRGSREREEHSERLSKLLEELTAFENNVESVRNSVLQSNKKLKMSEVEELTEALTGIGRTAANLKTDFPSIQAVIEARIKEDMERIVREEKYIRDQTAAVDQSLRRCKGLANIMVTMKKLAMVQDPSIHKSKSSKQQGDVRDQPSSVSHSVPSTPVPPSPNNFTQAVAHPPAQVHGPADLAAERPAPFTPTVPPKTQKKLTATVPPVPPPPASYQSDANSLDGVLEEVGKAGMPPRPPSRYSVNDVRTKFTKPPELPDQLKAIIDDVAHRASPSIDRDTVADRRQDLEERQQRLSEKQQQLRNQFQQLQQLTPLP